jgi:biotin transport system substrate-specific component
MTTAPAASLAVTPRPIGIRVAASLAGALLIAVAAQVAVPVPGSPVPMTLQPLAVLIVGGLLGPRFGALSAAFYLLMGAAGLPVFVPGGLPGAARLVGPTGGYLISYPFAAFAVGALAGRTFPRAVLATAAGLAIILVAGTAQLAIISGREAAVSLGFLPFVIKDLGSVLAAALVINRLRPSTRALQ